MFHVSRTKLVLCRVFATERSCSCSQARVLVRTVGVVLHEGNGRCESVHHADLPIKDCAAGHISKLIPTIRLYYTISQYAQRSIVHGKHSAMSTCGCIVEETVYYQNTNAPVELYHTCEYETPLDLSQKSDNTPLPQKRCVCFLVFLQRNTEKRNQNNVTGCIKIFLDFSRFNIRKGG